MYKSQLYIYSLYSDRVQYEQLIYYYQNFPLCPHYLQSERMSSVCNGISVLQSVIFIEFLVINSFRFLRVTVSFFFLSKCSHFTLISSLTYIQFSIAVARTVSNAKSSVGCSNSPYLLHCMKCCLRASVYLNLLCSFPHKYL